MEKQPHGIAGQINVLTLDIDSDITDHGKHNRLLVFRGTGKENNTIEVREDLRGLPASTAKQRQKALKGWQRQHKRGEKLSYVASGVLDEAIHHTYKVTA